MLILGLESSCDETSIAVIENKNILSHILFSQIDIHSKFGGVIPEIAARSHLEIIGFLLRESIAKSCVSLHEIDGFAATCGPGLAGGLIIGSTFAKTLSLTFNKPFLAVNHLQGHALLPTMTNDIAFPFLLLLVSGGHTQILAVKAVDSYELLGSTLDDAVGEAFDKTARLLGLPYPGGREIEKLAKDGDAKKYKFPRPLYQQAGCNFSFSGLKTALRDTITTIELNETIRKDICASLQKAIIDILIDRLKNAIDLFSNKFAKPKHFVISGGVAANIAIRESLADFMHNRDITMIYPPLDLCTDNGVMIAWAGLKKLEMQLTDSYNFPIKVRWSLESLQCT